MTHQRDFLNPLTWPTLSYGHSCGHRASTPIKGIYAIAGWTIDEYQDKKDPVIYYIGSSNDIARRLSTHPKESSLSHLFTCVRFYYETDFHLLGEKILIRIFKPQLNIQHNG